VSLELNGNIWQHLATQKVPAYRVHVEKFTKIELACGSIEKYVKILKQAILLFQNMKQNETNFSPKVANFFIVICVTI